MHFLVHIVSAYAIAKILGFNQEQTSMFVVANLVDVDHAFDGEISSAGETGDTFDNNFFHINWVATTAIGTLINPYLGMGLAYHFYMDLIQPDFLINDES